MTYAVKCAVCNKVHNRKETKKIFQCCGLRQEINENTIIARGINRTPKLEPTTSLDDNLVKILDNDTQEKEDDKNDRGHDRQVGVRRTKKDEQGTQGTTSGDSESGE